MAFLLSTETRLPRELFDVSKQDGQRVTTDGAVTLNAIGRVSGGMRDGKDLAIEVDGTLFPWPLPAA